MQKIIDRVNSLHDHPCMSLLQKKTNIQRMAAIAIIAGASIFFLNCGGEAERGFKKAISSSKIDTEKSNEGWIKDQGNWYNPYFTDGMPMPYRIKNSY